MIGDAHSELIQSIQTLTQRDYFLNELDLLLESLYKTQGSVDEKIKMYLSSPFADLVLKDAQKKGKFTSNIDDLNSYIIELKKNIKDLPVLQLRIGFEPKNTDVQNIYSWIQLHLKKAMILDMVVDRNIIGGAVIGYKGFYKDFSFQSLIDSYGRIQ